MSPQLITMSKIHIKNHEQLTSSITRSSKSYIIYVSFNRKLKIYSKTNIEFLTKKKTLTIKRIYLKKQATKGATSSTFKITITNAIKTIIMIITEASSYS